VTAALFVAAFIVYSNMWAAIMIAAFVALMPIIAVIDARHKIIPNRIVYPAFLAMSAYVMVAWLLGAPLSAVGAAIGCASYGGGLLLVALASPRGMGMGDVKLAGLIGLVLGSLALRLVLVAAGVGIVLGGLAAIGALLTGSGRKHAIPFGPFLASGAVIAALWGPRIAAVYLNALT
jgi:leader peptidase (prepilin peptidase)/N-methyltransferase